MSAEDVSVSHCGGSGTQLSLIALRARVCCAHKISDGETGVLSLSLSLSLSLPLSPSPSPAHHWTTPTEIY